jgi:hypothetical protein
MTEADGARVPGARARVPGARARVPVKPIGTSTAGHAARKSVSLPVKLKKIGVLGKTPDANSNDTNEVTKNHIVVDPAGLPYILGLEKLSEAGTLSEQIYMHYTYTLKKGGTKTKIRDLNDFPLEVKNGIKKEGDATLCEYNEGAVIHVVGPDFKKYPNISFEDAVAKLSEAYYSVIHEAERRCATNERPMCNRRSVVRLPLISMGAFAGRFQNNMHAKRNLTARTVLSAFARYTLDKEPVLEYWMCLYARGSAYDAYVRVFESQLYAPQTKIFAA